MNLKHTSLLIFVTSIFLSCGDNNTTTTIVSDIKSLQINESNLSMYATDNTKDFTSTVTYEDNTSRDANDGVTWVSSDTNVSTFTSNTLSVIRNGGDTNLSIEISQYKDEISLHVKELLSINYLNELNTSDTSNEQTLLITGNYENNDSNITGTNDSNITMLNSITWTADTNTTISESNSTQVTLTFTGAPSYLLGTLFTGTSRAVDFNKTW